MRAWLAVVAGICVAFLGGVGVGRWSQPVKVVEVTRTKEVAGKTIVQEVVKQAAEHDKAATRTVTRWIPQPQKCGDSAPPPPPIVEQVEEAVTDHQAVSGEKTRAATQEYHLLDKDERKLTLRPESHWHLTGLVGLTLTNPREVRSGLVLSHDLGPLQVGLWGMYGAGAAAGFAVGVSF